MSCCKWLKLSLEINFAVWHTEPVLDNVNVNPVAGQSFSYKVTKSPNANHDAMLIAITKEEETWADWLRFGLPHKIYTNTLYCMHLVARYQIYMLIGLCRNYKLIWCFVPWLIIVVELLKGLLKGLYVWYPRKLPLLPISWNCVVQGFETVGLIFFCTRMHYE